MNRRDSSASHPTRVQRPSLARSFTSSRSNERGVPLASDAEQGQHDIHASTEEAIHEEIAEIKRYEVGTRNYKNLSRLIWWPSQDFTTIGTQCEALQSTTTNRIRLEQIGYRMLHGNKSAEELGAGRRLDSSKETEVWDGGARCMRCMMLVKHGLW